MMPLHVDKGYGNGEDIDNPKTPSGFPTREISSIFYWNENYEGGEIVFPNQNKKIKPSSGMLILFPSDSNFPHRVLSVKSGIRYVSTNFWYCDWSED
jgi:predicted 2-oxoglutarate/Fe(II)-dependent dioxygenase YbiX